MSLACKECDFEAPGVDEWDAHGEQTGHELVDTFDLAVTR